MASKRKSVIFSDELLLLFQQCEIHPDFLKDIKDAMKRKRGTDFFVVFEKQLRTLVTERKNAVLTSPDFERLSHVNGLLCSMHINSAKSGNFRVLYAIQKDIFLLCGFEEISGKNNTDYSKPSRKAIKRLKELQEGTCLEKE